MSFIQNNSLLILNVRPGEMMESQSGIQMHNPKIFGRLEKNDCKKDIAFIIIHPTCYFAFQSSSCTYLNAKDCKDLTIHLVLVW